MRARGNRCYVMRVLVGFSARSGAERCVCGREMKTSDLTVCKRPHSAGVQSRGVFFKSLVQQAETESLLEASNRQLLSVFEQLIKRV